MLLVVTEYSLLMSLWHLIACVPCVHTCWALSLISFVLVHGWALVPVAVSSFHHTLGIRFCYFTSHLLYSNVCQSRHFYRMLLLSGGKALRPCPCSTLIHVQGVLVLVIRQNLMHQYQLLIWLSIEAHCFRHCAAEPSLVLGDTQWLVTIVGLDCGMLGARC